MRACPTKEFPSPILRVCHAKSRHQRARRGLLLSCGGGFRRPHSDSHNHDDFRGHAKRNEFDFGGKIQLVNGGTLGIESPRPYSAVAAGLLAALGIDPLAVSIEPSFDQADITGPRGLGASAQGL
jgi:hypothetical protein